MIEDTTIIAGFLPNRAVSLVVEWAKLHRQELLDNWNAQINRQPLHGIEPLP